MEWICACFISDKFFSSQHSSFTFSNTVGPDILCIINNCLSTGTVPACFKLATVTPTVLKWFQSFMLNRSFSVSLGALSSTMVRLTCDVPQGSILAPLLFSLYMQPLGSIMSKFGVLYYCHADDTQLYIKHNDTPQTQSRRIRRPAMHTALIDFSCFSHSTGRRAGWYWDRCCVSMEITEGQKSSLFILRETNEIPH